MTPLSIVFAGTPEFGLPCLDALRHSPHHIKAIYTQPDRPAGRGRKLQASAVKEWALTHNIPVYQPLNFKNAEDIATLSALNPDVIIVIAYGLILPKSVLEIPKLGCINVHASLLPRWRGASPIQQAILHGDSQSGVTLMQMDVGMDTGAMLLKVPCAITALDTAGSLHDKLSSLSASPLLAVLEAMATNTIHPETQNNALATYAGKILKEDARIRWQRSALEIDRQIRAFNPWPIAHAVLKEDVIRIHQAQATETECLEAPGTVIHCDKKGILVATTHKAILLERIQFPGGKAISVADWLNASKNALPKGTVFQ